MLVVLKIGLIACSKKKLANASEAKDLYCSPLFKAASQYAEKNYDKWLILSAKHGLLHPYRIIEPYDLSLNDMSAKERAKWSEMVLSQIAKLGLDDEKFYVHAGKKYQGICKYHANYHVPLAGLGIGQQLAWYKERNDASGR